MAFPKGYSKAPADQIRALMAQGFTDEQMAQHFGVTLTYMKQRRHKVKAFRPNIKDKPPEVKARVVELVGEGWPVSEITQELRVSPEYVTRWGGDAVRENSRDYRSLLAWWRTHHPDLYYELRKT